MSHRFLAGFVIAMSAGASVHAYAPPPCKALPQIRVPGAATPGVIRYNTTLTRGKQYFSPDQSVFLIHQTDGNLVLYKILTSPGGKQYSKALWEAHTWGSGAKCARFQSDGNLVVYRFDGKPLWNSVAQAKANAASWTDYLPPYGIDSQTYTNQYGKPYLVVQNDNNLVVYGGDGRPLWHSGTAAR